MGWMGNPGDADPVSADKYSLEHGGRTIFRTDAPFMTNVQITYTPVADNPRRIMALIDLVKLEVQFSGLASERVGSYQRNSALSDGNTMLVERNRILSRLRQNYAGAGLFSLMGARSFMTHRCDTERDVESAQPDPSGHPFTELRDINTALPCYWQVRTERLILDGGKAAAIAMHNMMAPLSSDLQEQDQGDPHLRPSGPDFESGDHAGPDDDP